MIHHWTERAHSYLPGAPEGPLPRLRHPAIKHGLPNRRPEGCGRAETYVLGRRPRAGPARLAVKAHLNCLGWRTYSVIYCRLPARNRDIHMQNSHMITACTETALQSFIFVSAAELKIQYWGRSHETNTVENALFHIDTSLSFDMIDEFRPYPQTLRYSTLLTRIIEVITFGSGNSTIIITW